MNQNYITKLAQIEERLHHVVITLDKIAMETDGLGYIKTQVQTQASEIKHLRGQFLQVKGAFVLLSVILGFIAGFVPDWLK